MEYRIAGTDICGGFNGSYHLSNASVTDVLFRRSDIEVKWKVDVDVDIVGRCRAVDSVSIDTRVVSIPLHQYLHVVKRVVSGLTNCLWNVHSGLCDEPD